MLCDVCAHAFSVKRQTLCLQDLTSLHSYNNSLRVSGPDWLGPTLDALPQGQQACLLCCLGAPALSTRLAASRQSGFAALQLRIAGPLPPQPPQAGSVRCL